MIEFPAQDECCSKCYNDLVDSLKDSASWMMFLLIRLIVLVVTVVFARLSIHTLRKWEQRFQARRVEKPERVKKWYFNNTFCQFSCDESESE
ncbi:hypothetical protein AVEN_3041-1 [Araneus ventricosus]|uniref:Uncharacterized protein n=1 Tax=Araneus ventricosus TaxID=182803 RepID=A0A4Y2KM01_ARAVE|nr:hypothetical protein AVEN_3041-1 [Araneus ventricosus]